MKNYKKIMPNITLMESSDDMDLKNIKWDKNNYNDFNGYFCRNINRLC